MVRELVNPTMLDQWAQYNGPGMGIWHRVGWADEWTMQTAARCGYTGPRVTGWEVWGGHGDEPPARDRCRLCADIIAGRTAPRREKRDTPGGMSVAFGANGNFEKSVRKLGYDPGAPLPVMRMDDLAARPHCPRCNERMKPERVTGPLWVWASMCGHQGQYFRPAPERRAAAAVAYA